MFAVAPTVRAIDKYKNLEAFLYDVAEAGVDTCNPVLRLQVQSCSGSARIGSKQYRSGWGSTRRRRGGINQRRTEREAARVDEAEVAMTKNLEELAAILEV